MDVLHDVLSWAWARQHNPLSWYIRPLFILPYCYFAYKKSKWGIALTIVGVLSSMFWFPAPETTDPRAAAFLAMEQQYITGSWTFGKMSMTALVPLWFVALAWAFWQRSWLAGVLVINCVMLYAYRRVRRRPVESLIPVASTFVPGAGETRIR